MLYGSVPRYAFAVGADGTGAQARLQIRGRGLFRTKNEVNYIKLRSLERAGFMIGYGSVRKLLSVTVQELAGLEEQTIEYLLRYQYGEQLIRKLAEAMAK